MHPLEMNQAQFDNFCRIMSMLGRTIEEYDDPTLSFIYMELSQLIFECAQKVLTEELRKEIDRILMPNIENN